ncbi:MAG: outer membrane protein assembly factor BamB family protein [Candidatus Zipacnadales bacterium]
MSVSRYLSAILLEFACLTAVAPTTYATEWPTYRYNSARTGVTPENVPIPLYLQWTYQSAHSPRPAWPEPGREVHRMPFDYAYEVVVANGLVYFGSSADHKVYALDLATGRERWSFFTEGPIRFSPTIAEGRIYVASDDGLLYCLNAANGKLLWTFRPGPRDERVMGNGQLISRWPLRTGVAVEDGIIYLSAGMWPSEGVYVYALRAADGEVLWENDTSGCMYVAQPHPGSYAMTGVSPQGYIVVSATQVFIPTGRNMPAAYDRQTGTLQYYRGAPDTWNDRWGGAQAFAVDELLFGGRWHIGPDIEVKLEECEPWKDDGLIAWTAANGQKKRDLPGLLQAVVAENAFYAWGQDQLSKYDMAQLMGGAKPEEYCKWTTPLGHVYTLILAGKTLLAGGRGTVTAISAETGAILSKHNVPGQVRSLAVAERRVVASTTEGAIVCFGDEPVTNPPIITSTHLEAPAVGQGYAVILRGNEEQIRNTLTHAQHVFCVEPDAQQAATLRSIFQTQGLYGTHVTVINSPLHRLPLPNFVADQVVIPFALTDDTDRSAAEIYRILRPGGGTIEAQNAKELAKWLRRKGIPSSGIRLCDQDSRIERTPLPDTGEWTHQYADAGKTGASQDSVVRMPARVLWFGDPGPASLVSRHWAGPAPLSVNGRLFVIGQHSVIAVDAYNGRHLWTYEQPKVGRYPVSRTGGSGAADKTSIYFAIGKSCIQLEAATGQLLRTFELPDPLEGADPEKLSWDYVAVVDGVLLGTVGYGTEGRKLFAYDVASGALKWQCMAEEAIHHDGIAADEGIVCVLDRTAAGKFDQLKRRGEELEMSAKIVAFDLKTGKRRWQTDYGLRDRTDLRLGNGVVLATGGGRLTAYDLQTGHMLSYGAVKMRHFPVIIGNTIYGEPYAYDIRTGEPRTRLHPFTGQQVRWDFRRSYGCGAVSGCLTTLMFRSGTVGFFDLLRDGGTYNFGGVRAGCYVNIIAAGGLFLMPPAAAGCTCSYSFQTTVALEPAPDAETWSIYSGPSAPETQDITGLMLNFGAPGDRLDDGGKLWVAYPRPAGIAVPVQIDAPGVNIIGAQLPRQVL